MKKNTLPNKIECIKTFLQSEKKYKVISSIEFIIVCPNFLA